MGGFPLLVFVCGHEEDSEIAGSRKDAEKDTVCEDDGIVFLTRVKSRHFFKGAHK